MEIEKVLDLMAALREEEVEYVLVGAIAMTVHGIVRATQDVDLFIQPSPENVARLRKALRRVFTDDPTIDQISDRDLAGGYPTVRYNSIDGSLSIDILARLGTMFTYEDIQFEEAVFEGIPVRVATPRMLYIMKKDTVRLQDKADAAALKERFEIKE